MVTTAGYGWKMISEERNWRTDNDRTGSIITEKMGKALHTTVPVSICSI